MNNLKNKVLIKKTLQQSVLIMFLVKFAKKKNLMKNITINISGKYILKKLKYFFIAVIYLFFFIFVPIIFLI